MSVLSTNTLAGSAGQGSGSGGGGGAANDSRSVSFNQDLTPYLQYTLSGTASTTYTWSFWLKTTLKASASQFSHMFNSNSNGLALYGDILYIFNGSHTHGTGYVLRDPSAWYHVVLKVTAGAGTLYVNNVAVQTLTSGSSFGATVNIGRWSSGYHFNGYLADIHAVDGQALDPTDFGEYDTNNVWVPKSYSGTYGTKGFKLDFSDTSSDSALGTDSSGNSHHFTVANLAAATGINYANSVSAAVSGSVPNGGTPYWVDILPTNADFDYSSSNGMNNVMDGSTSTYVFWTGSQYTGAGNVVRARFDLRDFPTITSLRINGYTSVSASYAYSFQLLDSSKTAIAGTSGLLDATSGPVWETVTLAGTPRYLEFSCDTAIRRGYLYAIEVNGTILQSSPGTSSVVVDYPVNGSQTDTGAGGEVIGNYATLNPLNKGQHLVLTGGNLTVASSTSNNSHYSTIGMSSGKWYAEFESIDTGDRFVGLVNVFNAPNNQTFLGEASHEWSYYKDGNKYTNNASATYGASYTNGDTVGIAFDADIGTLTFYKNGVSQGVAFTGLTNGPYFFAGNASSMNGNWNFGQRAFTNTAPSGYKCLCTANLPDPTIAKGSTAFDTKLWTGNSTDNRAITGYDFSPDFVWIKSRSNAAGVHVFDNVRGAGSAYSLATGGTDVQGNYSANGYLASFTSDGFTLGNGSTSNVSTNETSHTFVGWAWDAGSSNTTVSAGSISSGVPSIASTNRANSSAGFSIVSYTGNGSNSTIAHGLNAVPGMIIVKSTNVAEHWQVYHQSLPNTTYMELSDYPNAEQTSASRWNNTTPTSSVFTVGTDPSVNQNTKTYVAYCFAPVEGYSAFGSYLGTGAAATAPFVYLGFKPEFILFKNTNVSATNWVQIDATRNTADTIASHDRDNPYTLRLRINTADAEGSSTDAIVDFLSNGFKIRSTGQNDDKINGSLNTIIYAAFAEHPFKTARAI